MEKIDLLTQTVETEGYELHLEDYLKFEWYAAQLELTVDYFLDYNYEEEAN
jgi:hypothetical protein